MYASVAVQQRLRLFREGLATRLASESDIDVVGVVRTPEELVALCHAQRPDVAVVDADADEGQVARLARSLRSADPSVRLIGVVARGLVTPTTIAAPRSELNAVVSHADGVAEILRAIHRETWRARPAPARRFRTGRHHNLTDREAGVLHLVGAGCTSREISDRLDISAKTVENHKQRAFRKLGVQNRAHAVAVVVGVEGQGLAFPIDRAAG